MCNKKLRLILQSSIVENILMCVVSVWFMITTDLLKYKSRSLFIDSQNFHRTFKGSELLHFSKQLPVIPASELFAAYRMYMWDVLVTEELTLWGDWLHLQRQNSQEKKRNCNSGECSLKSVHLDFMQPSFTCFSRNTLDSAYLLPPQFLIYFFPRPLC
jgi:CRISPR/Cas system CMR subunit Cmr6 (Cas7 group RAMP superfamily)